MANYISEIQFYIGEELSQKYNVIDITNAYELSSSSYSNEHNRILYSAILIINRHVMSLAREMPVKSESTGIEKTEFQSLSTIISAYNQQVEHLKSEIKYEGFKGCGFAISGKRTWE